MGYSVIYCENIQCCESVLNVEKVSDGPRSFNIVLMACELLNIVRTLNVGRVSDGSRLLNVVSMGCEC